MKETIRTKTYKKIIIINKYYKKEKRIQPKRPEWQINIDPDTPSNRRIIERMLSRGNIWKK